MRKFLLLSLAAFCIAALISYNYKQPAPPEPLSPECYVSCYNHVMEAFKAEANTDMFASWHPNARKYQLVADEGATILFDAPDGQQAQGWFLKSKKKSKNWIFVIQEWWGLNDNVKREALNIYKELGENVNILALDMYDGKVAATPDSAMKLVRGAKTERLENIIKGAIGHAGSKANIYTIGWCFGGMWSLQASLLAGNQAAGCVMFYGRPENNIEKLKTLNCDVLGFFGNKDRSPSPEMVTKFEADMVTAGKKLTANKYEAGHGFANPSNPAYNKEATEDAYKKVFAFYKEKMGLK